MKDYLITGGAGFIGSHVCDYLLKSGKSVAVIDNFNDYYSPELKEKNIAEIKKSALNPSDFILYRNDITDIEALEKIFSKNSFKAIIHLAAYAGVRNSIDNPDVYVKNNVNGTANILEMMRKHDIKRLVFASSSSVYGNNMKVPFSESDNVDRPISPYAATKKACELICHSYHHLFKFNIACLRFFTVYGPRQRPDLAIRKFTEKIVSSSPITMFGDGRTFRDYTYITDIIDGIGKAIDWTDSELPRYDIFNLGESNTISLSKMIETIENTLGKKAVIELLPMQQGDVMRTYADISHSRDILNYNPTTDFNRGIKLFIDWYLSSFDVLKGDA